MALTVPTVAVGDDVLASWANDAKAAIDDLYTTVSDVTIGTVAAGFTVNTNGQVARTALGGKLVFVMLYLNSTNAITVTSGNIGDTTVFTLDAAYRPSDTISAIGGTGFATGEATVDTSGVVLLRSMSDPIAAGANLRLTFMFLTA